MLLLETVPCPEERWVMEVSPWLAKTKQICKCTRIQNVGLAGPCASPLPSGIHSYLDLKAAYLHIHVARMIRQYLSFVVGCTDYQFTSLPCGLSTPPRVFTECLTPVIAYCRIKGNHIYPYVDNCLIQAPIVKETQTALHFPLSCPASKVCGWFWIY